MRDRKYLQCYRMSYLTFQALVLELTPFLQSCTSTIRDFKNSYNCFIDLLMDIVHFIWLIVLTWVASTIQNYLEIVCDVLIDRNKLCTKYISIPSKN